MRRRRLILGLAAFLIAAAATAGAGLYYLAPNLLGMGPNYDDFIKDMLSPSAPVKGLDSAPVTIVEFGDFQCSACDYWFKTTHEQFVKNLIDTGKVRLVWRDVDVTGSDSVLASQAAYAAGEQGKFWEYYELLYARQEAANNGWASRPNLDKFAQELGLNMDQFRASVDSGKYEALIQSNLRLAQELKVDTLPTFFVVGTNGKVVTIEGAQPYSSFEKAVNSVMQS